MFKFLLDKIQQYRMNQDQYASYLRKKGVELGEGCDISKSANFGSEPWLIKIGNNVRITQKVQFVTHDGGLWTLRKMGLISDESVKYGKIRIGNNCNISWNVIIMPNVTIGDNCVIAAGAIVTKDVPSGEVWGGIPAKKIESVEVYCSKIQSDTVPTFSMSNEEKLAFLIENRPDLFE